MKQSLKLLSMQTKPKLSILTIDLGMGGTQRFTSLLLPELQKDFDVTISICYDFKHFEVPENVSVVLLCPQAVKTTDPFKKVQNFIGFYKSYKKVLKSNNFDVSLSLLPGPNIINSLVKRKFKNLRTVISERSYNQALYPKNSPQLILSKLLFPWFYNKNDALFSNSLYINENLRTHYKVQIPMQVIYNPINIDRFKMDYDIEEPITAFKIITSGTMYSAKNQKLILKAMKLLDSEVVSLTILGDGKLKSDLITLAKDLELSGRLDIKGIVADVKTYLIQSDCFVLPSNTEGFPNALLEALSCGLPCISTNCMSGPLEMLNDNNPISIEHGHFYKGLYGLLINVDDAQGLKRAITYFKNSPIERSRYGRLGLERAKSYNMSEIYAQIKSILNN